MSPHFLRTCHAIARALPQPGSGFPRGQRRILLTLDAATELADLRAALAIDAAQLSRALHALHTAGAVRIRPSATDGRRRRVELTAAGRRARTALCRAETEAIRALLRRLPDDEQARLVAAMDTARRLVDRALAGRPPVPRLV